MSSAEDVLAQARARQAMVAERTHRRLAKFNQKDGTAEERTELAMLERDTRAAKKILAVWLASRARPAGP
jgi:hypothetical protein